MGSDIRNSEDSEVSELSLRALHQKGLKPRQLFALGDDALSQLLHFPLLAKGVVVQMSPLEHVIHILFIYCVLIIYMHLYSSRRSNTGMKNMLLSSHHIYSLHKMRWVYLRADSTLSGSKI